MSFVTEKYDSAHEVHFHVGVVAVWPCGSPKYLKLTPLNAALFYLDCGTLYTHGILCELLKYMHMHMHMHMHMCMRMRMCM